MFPRYHPYSDIFKTSALYLLLCSNYIRLLYFIVFAEGSHAEIHLQETGIFTPTDTSLNVQSADYLHIFTAEKYYILFKKQSQDTQKFSLYFVIFCRAICLNYSTQFTIVFIAYMVYLMKLLTNPTHFLGGNNMRKNQFEKILKNLAAKYDTSPEEIYREMQLVIDAGFDNPDPIIQSHWRDIPHANARPCPEDVIGYIAMQMKMNSLS